MNAPPQERRAQDAYVVRRLLEVPVKVPVRLTPGERRVLDGIVAGKQDKQIAGEAGLSWHTIRGYRKSLYRKIGATTALEAFKWQLAEQQQAQANAPAA